MNAPELDLLRQTDIYLIDQILKHDPLAAVVQDHRAC